MPALPQQLDEIKKDQSRKNKIFSSEFCSCVQLAAELAAVSRDNCSCCVAGAADCCSCGRFRIAVRCMIRGEPEKIGFIHLVHSIIRLCIPGIKVSKEEHHKENWALRSRKSGMKEDLVNKS